MKKKIFSIIIIGLLLFPFSVNAQEGNVDSNVVMDPIDLEMVEIPPEGFVPFIGNVDPNPDLIVPSYVGSVRTYGPFYNKVLGSKLESRLAKYAPPSLNLDAASRRAVLAKYGRINRTKTYNIKWYNRIAYSKYGGSFNGKIVNYSCVN